MTNMTQITHDMPIYRMSKEALFNRLFDIFKEAAKNDLTSIDLSKSVVLTETQLEDVIFVAYMLSIEK